MSELCISLELELLFSKQTIYNSYNVSFCSFRPFSNKLLVFRIKFYLNIFILIQMLAN